MLVGIALYGSRKECLFSFITWLSCKDILSTGARMRSWGRVQLHLLCGEPDETRGHMFFTRPYSFTVWIDVVGQLLLLHLTCHKYDILIRTSSASFPSNLILPVARKKWQTLLPNLSPNYSYSSSY
ncbi:unnamed protein product [Cochlearia groenlandica]